MVPRIVVPETRTGPVATQSVPRMVAGDDGDGREFTSVVKWSMNPK